MVAVALVKAPIHIPSTKSPSKVGWACRRCCWRQRLSGSGRHSSPPASRYRRVRGRQRSHLLSATTAHSAVLVAIVERRGP